MIRLSRWTIIVPRVSCPNAKFLISGGTNFKIHKALTSFTWRKGDAPFDDHKTPVNYFFILVTLFLVASFIFHSSEPSCASLDRKDSCQKLCDLHNLPHASVWKIHFFDCLGWVVIAWSLLSIWYSGKWWGNIKCSVQPCRFSNLSVSKVACYYSWLCLKNLLTLANCRITSTFITSMTLLIWLKNFAIALKAIGMLMCLLSVLFNRNKLKGRQATKNA